MIKLSKHQLAMLGHLAAKGAMCQPTGYASAARDAAAWRRTAEVLVRFGLIQYRGDTSHIVEITDAGRAALGDK